MGRKSRDKLKLRKYEMEVEGRIIDLRRFAYDYLVYSLQKFGLPACCIIACVLEANDYPHSDFVQMVSRWLIRTQISYRSCWGEVFQRHYEETKFVSFSDVRSALIEVFNHQTIRKIDNILLRTIVYLSVTGELVLFLYHANCNLFCIEIAAVWPEYIRSDLKLFLRHGGLVELYTKFRTTNENPVDRFLNHFIATFCIPYNRSSAMCDSYFGTEEKYRERLESRTNQPNRPNRPNQHSIVRTICIDDIIKVPTSEAGGATGTSVPINTGLGITPHEELFDWETRHLDIEAETSPSTNQESVRNRRSSNRKEKLRNFGSRASQKLIEQLKPDLPGATSALVKSNPPDDGCRRENPRESIKRDGQETSNLLSREDIERVTSSFVSNVPSQQHPGASSQEASGVRKKSSGRNKREKKKPSLSRSRGDRQQLDIGGAPSSVPPQISPGTSRQETAGDMNSIFLEELKRLHLGSSKRKTSDDK